MNKNIKLAAPPWMINPPRDEVSLQDDPDFTGDVKNDGSSNNLKSTDQTLTQSPSAAYNLDQTKLIPESIQTGVTDLISNIDGLKRQFVELIQKMYRNGK